MKLVAREPAPAAVSAPEPSKDAANDAPQPTTAQLPVPVDIRSAALTILAVLAIILMLQYAQAVIIPIVLGLLISYALDPVVAALEKRHVPRPAAAALLLIAVVGAIVLARKD